LFRVLSIDGVGGLLCVEADEAPRLVGALKRWIKELKRIERIEIKGRKKRDY
jgi:hypothetical protein